MTKTTYNWLSLNRHDISPEEADDVLATGIWLAMFMFFMPTMPGEITENSFETGWLDK